MARRVLITGAAGFIGANLARRLIAEGEDVWLAVKPGSDLWRLAAIENQAQWLDLDLRDAESVERVVAEAQPQWVMHLAAHGAYSWQTDPWAITETNVLGTLRLLEACARAGVERFVNAGTSSEYGFRDHAPREDEAPERTATTRQRRPRAPATAGTLGARADFRRSPCGSTPRTVPGRSRSG